VVFLEAIQVPLTARIGEGGFSYVARECAIPLCRKCNNGRKSIGLESRKELEEMYIRALFQGNRAAAEADGHWRSFATAITYALAEFQRRAVVAT
jgi:hypothetical protein